MKLFLKGLVMLLILTEVYITAILYLVLIACWPVLLTALIRHDDPPTIWTITLMMIVQLIWLALVMGTSLANRVKAPFDSFARKGGNGLLSLWLCRSLVLSLAATLSALREGLENLQYDARDIGYLQFIRRTALSPIRAIQRLGRTF